MESTLADVARAAGCSNATVSRVINNMGQVSAAMREAVLRAVKELNYVPRPANEPDPDSSDAKPHDLLEVIYFTDMPYERLTLENSDLKIGPLTPYPPEERLSDGNWLSNSFYRLIVDGIVYEAPFWNLKPTIQLRSNLTDPQFLADVNRPEKAGVLLVGEHSAQLETFTQACKRPLVLVDLIVQGAAPVITFDNFSGIANAFEHLYALGHRRFGFLGGLQNLAGYKERLTAFRCKLVEHNLPVDERLIYTGSHHMAPTGEWADTLLRQPHRPTAFLCANDFMAIALLKAAHRAGLSVPRDLSVIGFDDVEPASLVTPALSSVRVPTFEVGRRAVQQLSVEAKLSTRRNRHGCCLRLAPELVVRESTAKPKD